MEPLKNIYNKVFLENLSIIIKEVIPKFNKVLFIKTVFDANWKSRELKQRMRHITLTLKEQLPYDYKKMITIILKITNKIQKKGVNTQSYEWMFFPEFIELYGLEDFITSVYAFEKMTQFTSCEFAIRPFIVKYDSMMMRKMMDWSQHTSKHVRRLASEGCRPMLPWSMALTKYKNDPKPIIPILDNLT